MCTTSWLNFNDGYRLFFNRDEKHTRRAGVPPEVRRLRGVSFISPLDGDHCGTWIAVNEFGLTLCLLNRHDGPPGSVSRGLLLLDLADSSDQVAVAGRLAEASLGLYSPFTLAALQPGQEAVVLEWDGRSLAARFDGDSLMPLTSSSHETVAVIARRRAEFRRIVQANDPASLELLRRFHRSHDPAPSAYSVCMHRDDAATVSFSSVLVSHGWIEFEYLGSSPCREGKESIHAIRLERAPSGGRA